MQGMFNVLEFFLLVVWSCPGKICFPTFHWLQCLMRRGIISSRRYIHWAGCLTACGPQRYVCLINCETMNAYNHCKRYLVSYGRKLQIRRLRFGGGEVGYAKWWNFFNDTNSSLTSYLDHYKNSIAQQEEIGQQIYRKLMTNLFFFFLFSFSFPKYVTQQLIRPKFTVKPRSLFTNPSMSSMSSNLCNKVCQPVSYSNST